MDTFSNSSYQCYFDNADSIKLYNQLINNNEEGSFSRYNFFLANYFLHKKQKKKAAFVAAQPANQSSIEVVTCQTKNPSSNRIPKQSISLPNREPLISATIIPLQFPMRFPRCQKFFSG